MFNILCFQKYHTIKKNHSYKIHWLPETKIVHLKPFNTCTKTKWGHRLLHLSKQELIIYCGFK